MGDTTSDSALLPRLRERSPEAFEILMRQNNRRLFRTARAILHDEAEAEDVVQATYLRAFTSLEQFAGQAALSTWLTRIAVNEALGRLRRSKRIGMSFEDMSENETLENLAVNDSMNIFGSVPVENPEDEAARAQMRTLVEHAVDALPAGFRAVFMLRAIEELSVEETAASLGIPEATVKTRFYRAKERLRAHLEKRVDLTLPEAFSFDGARCDRLVARVLEALQQQNAGTLSNATASTE